MGYKNGMSFRVLGGLGAIASILCLLLYFRSDLSFPGRRAPSPKAKERGKTKDQIIAGEQMKVFEKEYGSTEALLGNVRSVEQEIRQLEGQLREHISRYRSEKEFHRTDERRYFREQGSEIRSQIEAKKRELAALKNDYNLWIRCKEKAER